MLMLCLLIYLVVVIELSICFFIHFLAPPPFLSPSLVPLVVVVVGTLGPPSRASIRTPIAIPTAVNMDTIVIPCSLNLSVDELTTFNRVNSVRDCFPTPLFLVHPIMQSLD